MRGAEEGFVAVAGVGSVGVEGGGAVVEGHHAALLAHAVGVGDEVRVLLEGAGCGVDAAVLEEDGLSFELDAVDEDLEFFFSFIHNMSKFSEGSVGRVATQISRDFLCFARQPLPFQRDFNVNKSLLISKSDAKIDNPRS